MDEVTEFPIREKEVNKENFIGRVIQSRFHDKEDSLSKNIYYVTFIEGSRTKFHTHKSDQTLIATDGIGKLAIGEITNQIDDRRCEIKVTKEIVLLPKNAVHIPAGTYHCHGSAQKEIEFTHLAINGRLSNNTDWFEERWKTDSPQMLFTSSIKDHIITLIKSDQK
ncbi:MAG: hypothetical protein ACE5J2_01630 [Nitrososphaerales archaeon]